MRVVVGQPLTRKPQGLRMGKGKGRFKLWAARVAAGACFAEFQNIRMGRVRYFARQVRNRFAGAS